MKKNTMQQIMAIANQNYELCQVLAGFAFYKCVFCAHKDECDSKKKKQTMMKDICSEFDICVSECRDAISLFAERSEICQNYPHRKPFSDEFLEVDDNDDDDFSH